MPLLRELLAELRGPGRLQLDLKDERMPPAAVDALARQIESVQEWLIVGSGCAPSARKPGT